MAQDDVVAARAEVFGSVFVVAQHLTRRTDAALEPLGLTTRQWLLLAVLTKAFPDRSPSLTEAAEQFGTTRQNVKQIALALQSRGFLRLVSDPADRRATRLEVTERVAVFDETAGRERSTALLEAAFHGLSPDDTYLLRDLARRWLAGLAAAPDLPPTP